VLFIIMQIIFTYVDIGWDSQSVLYLGLAMGVINSLEHVVSKPVPVPSKRWRWQQDPHPAPQILPVNSELS
jgi:hypothetical protein